MGQELNILYVLTNQVYSVYFELYEVTLYTNIFYASYK